VDEYRTGWELGKQILQTWVPEIMLMFYDSVKRSPTAATPPVLNASPPLIRGIEESVLTPFPIVGGGVLGSKAFEPTYQFCGFSVAQQSAVAVLLSKGFFSHTCIIHGCTPKDGLYHRITRMHGDVVNEVDGRSIVDMITEAYGSEEWKSQRPVRLLAIGINHGERWGAFNENNYVNRLIVGVLPDDSGVVLFEPDLEVGTEFQFMLRDARKMVDNARQRSSQLIEQITAQGKTPRFGLYIDCAGRTAEETHTLSEEAAEVQKAFNDHDIPLLGFYSGVEIAPLLGKNRGLDWTGVLWIAAV
jgi:small ligand-binding sensory domain FIST